MKTKKLSFDKKEGKKAGVNNTQTTLTAAGLVAAAGVAAGAAGAGIAGSNGEDGSTQPHDVSHETAQNPETAQTSQATAATGQPEATGQAVSPGTPDTPDVSPSPSQPGPTTGNGAQPAADNTTPEQPAESTEQVVAQLLGGDEVDKDDIEAPTEIAMERFVTIYDEEGNEIDAAVIHSPDGTEYVLIDIDGDGTYDALCSPDLAQFMPMEVMITHSDLESQLGAGGYMAFVGSQPQPPASDAAADIINTDNGAHGDVATNEPDTAHAEEIDDQTGDEDIVDQIVSELLGNEDDVADETLVEDDVEDLLADGETDDVDETNDADDDLAAIDGEDYADDDEV